MDKTYLTKEVLLAICPKAEQNIKANPNFSGNSLAAIIGLMNRYADEFEITTPPPMGGVSRTDTA